MLSNLPPGCRECDIPGNRPSDIAWEKYVEGVADELCRIRKVKIIDDFTDEQLEWIGDKAADECSPTNTAEMFMEKWPP
jgi:hypothetical protein